MVESIAESIESMTAMTWAEANQAYLRTELRRLRLLFRRKVRWLRQHLAAGSLGKPPQRRH